MGSARGLATVSLQDPIERGQVVFRFECGAELSQGRPNPSEIERVHRLEDPFDVSDVSRAHRESFHHQEVLGRCDGKGDSTNFSEAGAAHQLCFERQHAEAQIDLDAGRIVDEQEDSGHLRELDGVGDARAKPPLLRIVHEIEPGVVLREGDHVDVFGDTWLPVERRGDTPDDREGNPIRLEP